MAYGQKWMWSLVRPSLSALHCHTTMVKAFLSRSKSTANRDTAADASSSSCPRTSSSSSVFPSLLKLDTSSPSSKPPSSSSRQSSGPQSAVTSRGDRPSPLVSLKLTAPSFLDVVVRDRESKQPIYIIETVRDSTSIYRLNSETDEAIKVSTVQWPNSITRSKLKSGRSVLMANDRWREAEELLKLGPLGSIGCVTADVFSLLDELMRVLQHS